MTSVLDALLFFPLLYCGLLVRATFAYCGMLKSAGQFVADVAYYGFRIMFQPLCDCYRIGAKQHRALTTCCGKTLSFVCTAIRHPTIALVTVLEHLPITLPTISSTISFWITPWCNITQTVVTVPYKLILHALSCLAALHQICSLWIGFLYDIPSCFQAFLPAACTQFKEGALPLLYSIIPDTCKTVYAWFFVRCCGASKQQAPESQALSHSSTTCPTTDPITNVTSSADTKDSNTEASQDSHPKVQPVSSSPKSVVESVSLFTEKSVVTVNDKEVHVPRLASLAFDKKVRGMMCAADGVPYQGGLRLRQCEFRPSYYELDPTVYPEECSLVGKGARGVVKFGQMQDAEGTWLPVALKFMAYDDELTRDEAKRESRCMKAIKDALNTATMLSATVELVEGKRMKIIAMKFLESVNIESHFGALRKWDTEADVNSFLPTVISFLEGVVEGIAGIHDAGWAHMDIKPDNLCAEINNGQLHPYVVDFGSSLMQATAPLGGTQSSIPCACPEVIQFMLHLNEELLDDISFQAQDVWSLGCLLVWLVTGDLPFLCFLEELEICKISQLECMCLKHAAWAEGNLVGPENMMPSSLDYFGQLTHWTAHPQMHQLFGLAEWMLQPVHGNRPTAREVLVELRAMSA